MGSNDRKRGIRLMKLFIGFVIAICLIGGTSVDACIHAGDVDLNGHISADDSQRAFMIVLGMISPTAEAFCQADCNADELVTSADAQIIFQMILGLNQCSDDWSWIGGDLYLVDPIVGNLMYIPSTGQIGFRQATNPDTPCGGSGPQFTHILTREMAVMETEVTRQMWSTLRSVQPSLPEDPSREDISPLPDYPVQNVHWHEVLLFANLLSTENQLTCCYYVDDDFQDPVTESNYLLDDQIFCDFDATGYRMPTEGEWEYFTRAGSVTAFSCHDPDFTYPLCNYSDCVPGQFPVLEQHIVFCANGNETTEPPGSKLPNPWNLMNVHGNVQELCWDWMGPYPTGTVTDYAGPVVPPTEDRVLRGGNFRFWANGGRSSARHEIYPTERSRTAGFRLVRTLFEVFPSPTPVPTETPTITPTVTPSPTYTPSPTLTPSPTVTPSPTMTAVPTNLYSVDNIVGDMLYIPSTGSQGFIQGSYDPCHFNDEDRFYHVLTRDMAVMRTEVTRQMWLSLYITHMGFIFDPTIVEYSPEMNCPVQYLTWYEALLFANSLSYVNGLTKCYYQDSSLTIPITRSNYLQGSYYCDFDAPGYRLPTEGEWEYFCRAGTTTPYSCAETQYSQSTCWGCTVGALPVLEEYCVFCSNDTESTAPVGSKLPNPWNLRDIHGNVWEWCWDWYGIYPVDNALDFQGQLSGTERVIRGGCWHDSPIGCRSAQRIGTEPDTRSVYNGFRLIRTINP